MLWVLDHGAGGSGSASRHLFEACQWPSPHVALAGVTGRQRCLAARPGSVGRRPAEPAHPSPATGRTESRRSGSDRDRQASTRRRQSPHRWHTSSITLRHEWFPRVTYRRVRHLTALFASHLQYVAIEVVFPDSRGLTLASAAAQSAASNARGALDGRLKALVSFEPARFSR